MRLLETDFKENNILKVWLEEIAALFVLQHTGILEIILRVQQPFQDLLTTSWDKPMERTTLPRCGILRCPLLLLSARAVCPPWLTFSTGTHYSGQGYRSPRKSTGNHLPLMVRSRTTLECASPSSSVFAGAGRGTSRRHGKKTIARVI